MKFISIYLKRSIRFHYSPIYEFTIYPSGLVKYFGEDLVYKIGEHTLQVSKENVLEIESLLDKYNYINISRGKTNLGRFEDQPSCITEITYRDGDNNLSSRIEHYYGDPSWPETLTKIEDEIDRLAGIKILVRRPQGSTKNKILIVDDDEVLCQLLSEQLEEDGYDTKFVLDGTYAIEELNKSAYDLVISNINMPMMSGLELLVNIRNINPLLPVIMLSAQSDPQTIVKCTKLGADDFMTKPYEYDILLLILEKYLPVIE